MVPCRKATEIQRYLDAFGMVDCVVFGVLTVYDYNAQLVVVNRTFAHESSSQYSSPECSRPHVMPTYMSAPAIMHEISRVVFVRTVRTCRGNGEQHESQLCAADCVIVVVFSLLGFDDLIV